MILVLLILGLLDLLKIYLIFNCVLIFLNFDLNYSKYTKFLKIN